MLIVVINMNNGHEKSFSMVAEFSACVCVLIRRVKYSIGHNIFYNFRISVDYFQVFLEHGILHG